jgi:hypothetical protein
MENHPGIFLAFEIATNNSQNVWIINLLVEHFFFIKNTQTIWMILGSIQLEALH